MSSTPEICQCQYQWDDANEKWVLQDAPPAYPKTCSVEGYEPVPPEVNGQPGEVRVVDCDKPGGGAPPGLDV